MQVAEVMTSGPNVLQGHLMIGDAARKMKALDTDRLLVLDGYVVTGVLTQEDVIKGAAIGSHSPERTRIRRVMTRRIAYCSAEEEAERVAARLRKKRLGSLVVLNGNDEVVGLVSFRELDGRSSAKPRTSKPDGSVSKQEELVESFAATG